MYNSLESDEKNDVGERIDLVPERNIETQNTVIREMKVDRLHLIGHSLGAMLAAEHVLRTPDTPVKSNNHVKSQPHTEIGFGTGQIQGLPRWVKSTTG
jgi:homoserine acetyltransferase